MVGEVAEKELGRPRHRRREHQEKGIKNAGWRTQIDQQDDKKREASRVG